MYKLLPIISPVTIIILLLLSSCSKQDPLRIDETIYVRHQGADMPAYVHGNPTNKTYLVVLHGAGSFGLSFRDGLFKEVLEDEFVVVYFDHRGQGMSQGHYSKPDDLIALMADDVNALIKVLKYRYGNDNSYFLMGHSLGGAIGKLALLRNNLQAELDGWISVSGAHDFPLTSVARKSLLIAVANEQIDLGNSIPEWNEIKNKVLDLDPDNEDDYKELLKQAGKANKLIVNDGVVKAGNSSEKLRNTILVNNPITWQISHLFNKPVNQAIENDFSLTNRLGEITIPSLLMYGKYDFSVPYILGWTAYPALGSSDKRMIVFEESMHHIYDTEAEYFVEEVYKFIDDVR